MEEKTLQEKLVDAGYGYVYAPKELDNAFIGLNHDYIAVYDEELVSDEYIPKENDGKIIFITRCKPEALDSDVLVIGEGDEAKALNAAIIGVSNDGRAVYDFDQLIEAFMSFNDWTYDEAVDWYEVNTLRSLPYYANHPYVVTNIDYML
jgi:hypothetical protein